MIAIIVDFLWRFLIKLLFAILDSTPEWLAKNLHRRFIPDKSGARNVVLVDPSCGNSGLDLGDNRLLISSAFGSYFSGLLERDESYVSLNGQILVAGLPESDSFDPFQKIYWAFLDARGPQVAIIAGEGGMGKSTLAAKIIRCLYSQRAVDLILGDSAKTQEVDPLSGSVRTIDSSFYGTSTFITKMEQQLGLPMRSGRSSQSRRLSAVTDSIAGRRAIVVIDNLETVARGSELLNALRFLSGRDLRILVTTRDIRGLSASSLGPLLIRLQPLKDVSSVQALLRWHIETYAASNPDLLKVLNDIEDKRRVAKLLARTGGIPLLIQLLVGDVARTAWDRLDSVPELFGEDLLRFLYQQRWDVLGNLGQVGELAKRVLVQVQLSQYRGQKITMNSLQEWAEGIGISGSVQESIRILQQQFLLLNSDAKHGNYAIFPSLSDFLARLTETSGIVAS